MAQYETLQHDVLIIGAGGAGLRAAIEASAAGVSVGLVCKSLLGKAHTVMAEGGIAAALGNVDDRDNWKVPLRTYECLPRFAFGSIDLMAIHSPERNRS